MVRRVDTDFSHIDERGSLVQLVHEGFSQINVLTTRKGVYRGGHYHKISRERFYVVSGCVELTVTRDGQKEMCRFRAGDFFEITPFTVHSMFFPEDCVMVAMYDIPVEKADGSKDIYSAEV